MDLVGNPNDPAGDPDYNGINCPVTDNYEESFALPSMNDLGKPINNVSKIVIETFFHYDLSIENIIWFISRVDLLKGGHGGSK